MRISSGLRSLNSRLPQGTQGKESLEKTEIVADLFNNPLSQKDSQGDSKLRLSNASRLMREELKNRTDKFLKENPNISKHLGEIHLEASAYSKIDPNSQPLRKITNYLHWLRIHEESEGEPTEQEAPYLAIHQEEKDNELRELFEQQETKRIELKKERAKLAPSYYYLAYPEAYAFN
jgi:hypothetical protein